MISTKGRYALRVMIDLAENGKKGPVPLKDVAERQEISKKYLELIVRDLVKGGLIKGSSGKGGGYILCKKPEEYTVGEIIELTEGTIAAVACLAGDEVTCPRASQCKTLPMWSELDALVRGFFDTKKLSDLL
ncbi:MAG: Rrf2 family transcriptional regulator [Clostridia bacterium]|nr:Rrf2 family transcriptional regulator [Clostridia bacterium]